VHSLIHSSS